jgi:hypothetical protein
MRCRAEFFTNRTTFDTLGSRVTGTNFISGVCSTKNDEIVATRNLIPELRLCNEISVGKQEWPL